MHGIPPEHGDSTVTCIIKAGLLGATFKLNHKYLLIFKLQSCQTMMSKKDARKFVYSLPDSANNARELVNARSNDGNVPGSMARRMSESLIISVLQGKGSHFLITDPQQKWKILHASDGRYKKSHGHHVK
ncbi:uncharacterized protein LOC133194215 [Saccostrea echinata]|uniref:uncharacterized protein LOC133194215 n=1 Tax=Saccostrea echinata TaxID=191078 RepID=UPI002A821B51|nr:uncharacterized protein LOC133194215 [Saccostrea echinata]